MCEDCGLPYDEFGLDMVLPTWQWLLIHPEGEGGLLCGTCICRRAEKLTGATVVLARFDLEETHES
jgi:hypothetical protein